MSDSPFDALTAIQAAVTGGCDSERILAALTALRLLRQELATWEPVLITAARAQGTSWAALAPALGVASRQAAERRYLRLQPSATDEATGEARVEAERDKRAGDRAVNAWARQNSASLRKLAGQVSGLDDLDAGAQERVDRLTDALGDDDAANLLPALAAAQPDVVRHHAALAEQLVALGEHTGQVRRDAVDTRHERSR